VGREAEAEAYVTECHRSNRPAAPALPPSTPSTLCRLKILFGLAGLPASCELHGDMTQAARLESLERFRKVGGGWVWCGVVWCGAVWLWCGW
jgi:hypothetical protein